MEYFCTTCSAEKDTNPNPMPAIDRYRDNRVRIVCRMATLEMKPFVIFSGLYGLIPPESQIPYYDHQLEDHQVPVMVEHMRGQLEELMVTGITFFGPGPEEPGWRPYYDAIMQACALEDVTFSTRDSRLLPAF